MSSPVCTSSSQWSTAASKIKNGFRKKKWKNFIFLERNNRMGVVKFSQKKRETTELKRVHTYPTLIAIHLVPPHFLV